ncbi:MAG: NAD(P)-binding protein [Legionella sp.]
MKKVIIGAGPSGLYTAIKLKKEGIHDIIIYDPRAGNYTILDI